MSYSCAGMNHFTTCNLYVHVYSRNLNLPGHRTNFLFSVSVTNSKTPTSYIHLLVTVDQKLICQKLRTASLIHIGCVVYLFLSHDESENCLYM